MKEIINGLKFKLKRNKKKLYFLLGLALIGFISGSIFITFLSKTDEALVKEYIETFIKNIDDNKLNYIEALKNSLKSNLLYVVFIWILGISIIGLPINIFIFFSKNFMLGFSLSAFFLTYKIKGIFLVIIYLIPQILNIFILIILMLFAVNFSLRLCNSIFKRETLDFKVLFNNYLGILILVITLLLLTSLIEVFVVPFVIDKILFIM